MPVVGSQSASLVPPWFPWIAPKINYNSGPIFCRCFGRFLLFCWLQNGSKNQQKIAYFSDRFLHRLFELILYAHGFHFGSILATKIDPGGARARKGRPLILNDPPPIFYGFGIGRCPGGAKIHIKTASENQCDF